MKKYLPLVALMMLLGCSKEELPESKEVEAVSRTIGAIVKFMVPEAATPVVRELDVSELDASQFKREMDSLKTDLVTLWMPSEHRWVLVGWNGEGKVNLAEAMEKFSLDAEESVSIPEIFASYVGSHEDVLPAFSLTHEGKVLPEWFVTKDIPVIKWLCTEGVDKDILSATLTEITELQRTRRLILEANMLSRAVKTKEDEPAVTERWAKAFTLNPHDPMLLERIEILNRNAAGFLEVNKIFQAMKCYETIVLINPKDAAAIHNFGICLKRIGKLDLADKVLKQAERVLNEKL